MVEALRHGLTKAPVKREEVSSVLTALPETSMTELLNQYTNFASGGTRLTEVTMVGRDGMLIQ